MAKFILFALVILAQGCGRTHDSMDDAKRACEAWKEKGIIHEYKINQLDGQREVQQYARLCDLEKEANQVVGYESETVRKAKSWGLENRIKFRGNGDYLKTKYFKYSA